MVSVFRQKGSIVNWGKVFGEILVVLRRFRKNLGIKDDTVLALNGLDTSFLNVYRVWKNANRGIKRAIDIFTKTLEIFVRYAFDALKTNFPPSPAYIPIPFSVLFIKTVFYVSEYSIKFLKIATLKTKTFHHYCCIAGAFSGLVNNVKSHFQLQLFK